MLTAGQITFLTITAGPVVAFILWFVASRICKTWAIPHPVVVTIFGNSVTIIPILCLMYNIIVYVWLLSFTSTAPETFLDIRGNEGTIFIALMYASVTLGYVTIKSIRDSRTA